MAITKTSTIQRIEVQPGVDDPMIIAVYTDTFDDPDDDQLPHTSQRVVHLERQTHTIAEDGTMTTTDTDVSGHDALVQTIAAAVWTD